MIPKSPFSADLSLEEEIAAFEGLKPRLTSLWNALSAHSEEPFTSVVIPSMTLDRTELMTRCTTGPSRSWIARRAPERPPAAPAGRVSGVQLPCLLELLDEGLEVFAFLLVGPLREGEPGLLERLRGPREAVGARRE